MIANVFGNKTTVDTLETMIRDSRIPQTILLSGSEGVGKATLARRFAAALLPNPDSIEADDLSTEVNLDLITDREKWAADKRSDEPLFFSAHPDFVTFPPDGPLRQISIQQMRLLKEKAQFGPLKGRWRIFLIDHIDRANEQAANSLLKTLEEPPPYLILIMTAENAYDLLPTIRSRAVQLALGALGEPELKEFVRARGLDRPEQRIALASGSPGLAISIDLEAYSKRRTAMLALLRVASGQASMETWVKFSDSIGASKSEKLDSYLKVLYMLLEDLLVLLEGGSKIRNIDLETELRKLSSVITFEWIRKAVGRTDELVDLARRNIQKGIALDALAVSMRKA